MKKYELGKALGAMLARLADAELHLSVLAAGMHYSLTETERQELREALIKLMRDPEKTIH